MRNNVSEDLAFGLDDNTRQAWCIVFSCFEGAKFNWRTWEFERPS